MKFDQALNEITKALYLLEAPHWYQSRRWDAAALLASAQSIMRELERELHVRNKKG